MKPQVISESKHIDELLKDLGFGKYLHYDEIVSMKNIWTLRIVNGFAEEIGEGVKRLIQAFGF